MSKQLHKLQEFKKPGRFFLFTSFTTVATYIIFFLFYQLHRGGKLSTFPISTSSNPKSVYATKIFIYHIISSRSCINRKPSVRANQNCAQKCHCVMWAESVILCCANSARYQLHSKYTTNSCRKPCRTSKQRPVYSLEIELSRKIFQI